MKWLFVTIYFLVVTYGAYWLIVQTGSYWWILLWILLLPHVSEG